MWVSASRGNVAAEANFRVWDGDPTTDGLSRAEVSSTGVVPTGHTMDASGAILTDAAWAAIEEEGAYAGNGIDIEVTKGLITVTRRAASGVPNINCFAAARKLT